MFEILLYFILGVATVVGVSLLCRAIDYGWYSDLNKSLFKPYVAIYESVKPNILKYALFDFIISFFIVFLIESFLIDKVSCRIASSIGLAITNTIIVLGNLDK